jgi:hypothetical protein
MISRDLRTHLTAIAGISLLVLVLLGPINPFGEVWGGHVSDVVNQVNLLEWQAEQAKNLHLAPTKTEALLYPDGGTVLLADALGSTLVVPAVWAFGPMFAYNLLIFLDLVFGCWAMFWLVRKFTGDPWSAFLAGVIFGLSPLTLGHVNNGVTESLQTGWLPLFVGAAWMLFQDAREPESRAVTARRIAFFVVVWWAATVASHWYYGIYGAGMLTALTVAYANRPERVDAWKRLAYGCGIMMFAILPVAWRFLILGHGDGLLTREVGPTEIFMAWFNSADLKHFFSAREPIAEGFLHLAYLGLLVPLLAIVGLYRSENRRTIAGWVGGAAIFGVLAMGPYLVINSETFLGSGGKVALPYFYLEKIVPFLSSLSFPYRVFILAHLCLAVAIGIGLAGLWRTSKLRGLIFTGIAIAVLAETALVSGAPIPMFRQPIDAPAPIRALAAEPGEFAVFDLPIRSRIDILNNYVTNQIFHNRPILYSNFQTSYPFTRSIANNSLVTNALALIDGVTPETDATIHGDLGRVEQASQLLKCLESGVCPESIVAATRIDLGVLSEKNITRFVLHMDLASDARKLTSACEKLFGPPVSTGENVAVFALTTPFAPGILPDSPPAVIPSADEL